MVKTMCSEAEIEGNKSLRVAGVSCLFNAGVPEKIIQQRSGHRSVDGLRVYERVTNSAVSKILTNSDTLNFDNTLAQLEFTTSDVIKSSEASEESKPLLSSNEQSSVAGSASFGSASFGNQYNNCQVNVYSAPTYSPRPYGFPPSISWMPPGAGIECLALTTAYVDPISGQKVT